VPAGETQYLLNAEGIHVPAFAVAHRDQEYDSQAFDVLLNMQARHFWYRGRHRFLLRSFQRHLRATAAGRTGGLRAVDLGGGCGGWVNYLQARMGGDFQELALADSALDALQRARSILPANVTRYQIDLLRLGWRDRWDAAFLLDVLEHIPADAEALAQARAALQPGGLIFVTTPAFKFFWSYNDDFAHHVRRYTRADFARLAEQAGLRLLDARYFMFFLSPLLWLARGKRPAIDPADAAAVRAFLARTHRVPAAPVNALLGAIFAAETPLGHALRFPWGTSILGVFQKPAR
jgi:SAM-dependent methyltransferase